jgi:hypothetical protein
LVYGFTFPNYERVPASRFQGCNALGVAGYITGHFWSPVVEVGLWQPPPVAAILVLMPEAPMNEDYLATRRKHQIGFAW